MPLPIPNLDDRDFEALVSEARALIPVYDREWTDHNSSDPGIMLLELFAWISESLIYRSNQIPEASYRRFLKLLGCDALFTWERLPGEDNGRLLDFLAESYALDWRKNAVVQRTATGTLEVTNGKRKVTLELDETTEQVRLEVEDGPQAVLQVKTETARLFDWQKVPGADNWRLVEFLVNFYDAQWVKQARIEKSADRQSIWVTDHRNRLELQLDPVQNQVKLVFDLDRSWNIAFPTRVEYLFKWERVPGSDTSKLQDFLSEFYGIHWSAETRFEKETATQAIVIHNGRERLRLQRDASETRVNLVFKTSAPLTLESTEPELNLYWEQTPGASEAQLLQFLMKYYGVPWVKNAAILKSADGRSIVVTDQQHWIRMNKLQASAAVRLQFDVGGQYQFDLRQEINPLFCWRKVPGEHSPRLLEYLYKTTAVTEWVRKARVERLDEQTLVVSGTQQRFILQRNSLDTLQLSMEPGMPMQFSIQRALSGFFDWERFNADDQASLRGFLLKNYGLEWVAQVAMIKDPARNQITLQNDAQRILVRANHERDQVVISFYCDPAFAFQLRAAAAIHQVYQDLEDDLLRGQKTLARHEQAITASDYENLTRECLEKLKTGLGSSARVLCVPNRDWEYSQPEREKPGHLSILVIPGEATPEMEWENLTAADQGELRGVLWVSYQQEWLKTAPLCQDRSGKVVSVAEGLNRVFLIKETLVPKLRVVMGQAPQTLEVQNHAGELWLYEPTAADQPQFCWNHLPGADNQRLIDYLKRIYRKSWVQMAQIQKIAPEWLQVSDLDELILLQLEPEQARVTVYLTAEPFDLDYRLENGRTRIYAYAVERGRMTGLLQRTVLAYLNQRRMLTTRVHVVEPDYQQIKLEVNVVLTANANSETTVNQVIQGINRYFDPVCGGPDQRGWILGRQLYRSEIAALVEGIAGVDHISGMKINDNEEATMAQVAENQLIAVNPVVRIQRSSHE